MVSATRKRAPRPLAAEDDERTEKWRRSAQEYTVSGGGGAAFRSAADVVGLNAQSHSPIPSPPQHLPPPGATVIITR